MNHSSTVSFASPSLEKRFQPKCSSSSVKSSLRARSNTTSQGFPNGEFSCYRVIFRSVSGVSHWVVRLALFRIETRIPPARTPFRSEKIVSTRTDGVVGDVCDDGEVVVCRQPSFGPERVHGCREYSHLSIWKSVSFSILI